MIALMAIWFGRLAGLPSDGGYFYLCPTCYSRVIEPHLGDVVSRLVEQHPFLHRLAAAHEAHRSQPARQAGAHPVPVDADPGAQLAEPQATSSPGPAPPQPDAPQSGRNGSDSWPPHPT